MASVVKEAASPKQRLGLHLQAFWAGFTQPNPFSFLLMLAVFCGTVAVLVVCARPALFVGTLGDYIPRSSDNDEAFATIEALRLADPHRPVGNASRLFVLGNSRIAQTFANDKLLKKDLQNVTHKDWDVFFLTTGRQGALDETALADYATKRQPGVVVLSVSFDRYENDVHEYMKYYRMSRIGYRSDWADEQVRDILHQRPRRRTGIYIVDNRRFILLNASSTALRLLAHKPAHRKIDSYIFEQNPRRLALYRSEILKSLRLNHKPGKLGVSFLEDTTRRLKQRGNRVVLFDIPISAAILTNPVDRERYATHLKEAAALSAKLGARYCRPTAEDMPPSDAYRDYYHIADPASQERLRMVLARCVASLPGERNAI